MTVFTEGCKTLVIRSQVPLVKTKATPESDPIFTALGGDL